MSASMAALRPTEPGVKTQCPKLCASYEWLYSASEAGTRTRTRHMLFTSAPLMRDALTIKGGFSRHLRGASESWRWFVFSESLGESLCVCVCDCVDEDASTLSRGHCPLQIPSSISNSSALIKVDFLFCCCSPPPLGSASGVCMRNGENIRK